MPLTRVTSNVIQDGTITDADISASAAIAPSKMGAGQLPSNVNLSTVAGANTYYLAPRTDGIAGNGLQSNPFDVSSPQKWVDVLTSLPNNCTIRLLAGNYNIRGLGFGISNGALVFPDGCSVIGDGMQNTILTVTEIANPNYTAIQILGARGGNYGNPYITEERQKGCVVSDLTIDCNWQTFRSNNAKCGAINIGGIENNSIKRCRVINFGGQASSLQEAFPVAVGGDNGLIEECVVENPQPGVGDTEVYSTYVLVGGNVAIWQQIPRSLTSDSVNNTLSQQQRYELNDKFSFEQLVGGFPLVVNKTYYVVNPTNNGNTFQLSETQGGTAINFDTITSAIGCGQKTLYKTTVRNNIFRGSSKNLRDGFGVICGAGFKELVIEGNVFENLAQGIYGDSWLSDTLIVQNNHFINCRTCIRGLYTLGNNAGINKVIIQNNIFDGYGVNLSGNFGNRNILGGWSARFSEKVKEFTFENNWINSVDGLPISEATPFVTDCDKIVIRNNKIDSVCQFTSLGPSRSITIEENNSNELGVPVIVARRAINYIEVSNSAGEQAEFTADANSDTISPQYRTNFVNDDFVYVYNLTNGSGLNLDTRYFVKNLVTDVVTKKQTFQLFTQKTGGTLVDITQNYTLPSMISNRECRNGLALEEAIGAAKSLVFDKLNLNIRPLETTIYLKEGIYEMQNGIVSNMPINSVTISSTISDSLGIKTLNIGTSHKTFEINKLTKIIDASDGSRQFHGKLISINSTTGEIQIDVDKVYGSGTITNARIVQDLYISIIGLGNNKNTIIRYYNGVIIETYVGVIGQIHIENLTLLAWGPSGEIIRSGANSSYFKNVVFSQGAGATRAVGPGNFSLGLFSTFIDCYSDALLYDTALGQGDSRYAYVENCRFLNGFSPSVQGSIFRNCEINTPFLNVGNGVFENSVFKSNNSQILLQGGKIYNSRLDTARVQVDGTGNEIHNTTITTTSPTSIFGNGHTVDIFNVGSNAPIDGAVIKTTNLTSI